MTIIVRRVDVNTRIRCNRAPLPTPQPNIPAWPGWWTMQRPGWFVRILDYPYPFKRPGSRTDRSRQESAATKPRKQQRAMIMQCFRLMLSSGVLRTPHGSRIWLVHGRRPPNRRPSAEPRQQMSPGSPTPPWACWRF